MEQSNEALIDKTIELFFFDPRKTIEQYDTKYKSLFKTKYEAEHGVRYSPLFRVQKDIRSCFGIGHEFNPIRNQSNFPQTCGIILINLAFTNIVSKLFDGDWPGFAKQYMGIKTSDEVKAIRYLRNALEHNFYGLDLKKRKLGVSFSLGNYSSMIKVRKLSDGDYQAWICDLNPKKLCFAFLAGMRQFGLSLLHPINIRRKKFGDGRFGVSSWVLIR